MRSLLFVVICYFAGQGASSSLEAFVSFLDKRNDRLDVDEIVQFRRRDILPGNLVKQRTSSVDPLLDGYTTHPRLTRRSGRGSSPGKKSASSTPSRAGSGELSAPPSPRKSVGGGSPRLPLGNARLIAPSMRGSPSGRWSLGAKQPPQIVGSSPRRITSSASMGGSSTGRISHSSFGSLDSLVDLSGSDGLATGKSIGKGPATLRGQNGENQASIVKLRSGIAGSVDAIHDDHIRVGGTAGRSRSPSPGRSPSPPREKSRVVGYSKGDLVHVDMDLTKGGTGCIEDCGGTEGQYKSAHFSKIEPPTGQKTSYLFKGSATNNTPAQIRAEIKEPASFDITTKQVPPGEDRAKWLG